MVMSNAEYLCYVLPSQNQWLLFKHIIGQSKMITLTKGKWVCFWYIVLEYVNLR